MSLVLLCATGLFLRSLQSATGIDIGFRSHNILMMSVDPRVHGYTPERTVQLLTQARERVAALPGVISAVATDTVPLSGGTRSDGFKIEGHPNPTGPWPIADLYMATPGYFETMGIPRLSGRDFANESPTGPKVAIINQAFAQKLFGNQNPIGQRITGAGVTYQIIGVVKDIKSRTLGEDQRYILFRSLDQTVAYDPAFMGYTLLVRTAGDSAPSPPPSASRSPPSTRPSPSTTSPPWKSTSTTPSSSRASPARSSESSASPDSSSPPSASTES